MSDVRDPSLADAAPWIMVAVTALAGFIKGIPPADRAKLLVSLSIVFSIVFVGTQVVPSLNRIAEHVEHSAKVTDMIARRMGIPTSSINPSQVSMLSMGK